MLPPTPSQLATDESYNTINALCLRNASLANVLDGCSVSMPFQYKSHHIGVMVIGANGDDPTLLNASKQIETLLSAKQTIK